MHSGYILSWRKKIRSDVWKMPPMYMRVFEWIIHSVNHDKKIIPTPAGALTVEPGQRVTSLRQIAEGVAYFEYGVERIPNTKTISVILDWLKSNGIITVESNAKGTVITVIKWSTYNAEINKKVTQSKQQKVTEILHGPDTNKNEYNEYKKPIGKLLPICEAWRAFVEMRKLIKKPMTDYAMKLRVNDLKKLQSQGHDPIAVLNQSISSNWQDLYPIKSAEVVSLATQQPDLKRLEKFKQAAEE